MTDVDYADWLTRGTWTLVEASCLAASLEPPASVNYFDRKRQTTEGRIYVDLKDAIRLGKLTRIDSDGSWPGTRVTPSAFIGWLLASPSSTLPVATSGSRLPSSFLPSTVRVPHGSPT